MNWTHKPRKLSTDLGPDVAEVWTTHFPSGRILALVTEHGKGTYWPFDVEGSLATHLEGTPADLRQQIEAIHQEPSRRCPDSGQ